MSGGRWRARWMSSRPTSAAWTRAWTPTGCRLWARCGSCVVTWPATWRFPPDQVARAVGWAIAEIVTERVPERRLRAYLRAVKRKMSGYKLKRAHHRSWPQPTMFVADAVVVLSKAG